MSEALKPPSQEFSLPNPEEIIGLTHKLRDLIQTDPKAHHKHIRGYGDGQALDVDFPDGSQRKIVWIDGKGILAWSDRKTLSNLFHEVDCYNLIYVNPEEPSIRIAGVKTNENTSIGHAWVKSVNWSDLCNLLSLAQQLEEA